MSQITEFLAGACRGHEHRQAQSAVIPESTRREIAKMAHDFQIPEVLRELFAARCNVLYVRGAEDVRVGAESEAVG